MKILSSMSACCAVLWVLVTRLKWLMTHIFEIDQSWYLWVIKLITSDAKIEYPNFPLKRIMNWPNALKSYGEQYLWEVLSDNLLYDLFTCKSSSVESMFIYIYTNIKWDTSLWFKTTLFNPVTLKSFSSFCFSM